MVWFWLGLTIALVVLEISTTQLISVWFAVGSAVATIVLAIFPDLMIGWQIMIFVLASLVLLVATRPMVKKLLKQRSKSQETNLELVIGKDAIVVEDIDNILGKGAVKINGLVWSARSANGDKIPEGTIVLFAKIDGNKAIVEIKGE